MNAIAIGRLELDSEHKNFRHSSQGDQGLSVGLLEPNAILSIKIQNFDPSTNPVLVQVYDQNGMVFPHAVSFWPWGIEIEIPQMDEGAGYCVQWAAYKVAGIFRNSSTTAIQVTNLALALREASPAPPQDPATSAPQYKFVPHPSRTPKPIKLYSPEEVRELARQARIRAGRNPDPE